MRPTKVLFVLKQRGEPYYGLSSDTTTWNNRSFTGLSNSVRYIVQMLHTVGVEAKAVSVVDNNAIDAEVTKYQPTHVIIEALWVVPSKFAVLRPRHAGVFWNVRLHSEVPFIAQEGIAMEWIFGYLKAGISVSANAPRMQAALAAITGKRIPYTPNYYPLSPLQPYNPLPADNWIDIGCFGAIRPLKNQLSQAVGAIEFANQIGQQMRFHINADRVEGGALAVLHNIQALFANTPRHKLVEHGWMDTAAFIALLKTMDLAMQVSFSETFNICSADAAVLNVPLVVSPEVAWAEPMFQANPTDIPDIVSKMMVAWSGRAADLQRKNFHGLVRYDAASEKAWPTALQQMAGMI
jgi:hypothetical protein